MPKFERETKKMHGWNMLEVLKRLIYLSLGKTQQESIAFQPRESKIKIYAIVVDTTV